MTDSSFISLPTSVPKVEDVIGPDPDASHPHVRFIEISTLSGSASLHGSSGELGNQLDTAVLLGLRERADVIVVGSRTVLAEDYGGAQPSKDRPNPAPIAVITNSFNVDVASKFVQEAITPPLVVASDQALADPELADKREALQRAGVELVNSGNGTATEIVQALSARGLNRIVCEGGPGIFGLFIADKMLDQLYLTLDPTLTTDVEKNLVSAKAASSIGISHNSNLQLSLEQVVVDSDSTVFLRYAVPSNP